MAGSTEEEEALMKLIELASFHVPVALRAAMELNVMDILAKHGGHHQFLSPSQIVSHFDTPLAPTTSLEQAASSLDRILRVLASNGLLSSSLHITPHQDPIRTYALNSLSLFLVPHNGQSSSIAPYLRLFQDPTCFEYDLHLHESILDGSVPFIRAFGSDMFSFFQDKPDSRIQFSDAMAAHTELFMQFLLKRYNGFDDIASLVDVGGGVGASLGIITSKHPHIKGINFDQSHMIAGAPEYPGVKHVAGDMFEMIPKADGIFMKWILHDWSDAHCLKILDNCYKALPDKGKVIVIDAVLSDDIEYGLSARLSYKLDMDIFSYCEGKERTKRELERISKASGFARLEVVCNILGYGVVEIHKEVASS